MIDDFLGLWVLDVASCEYEQGEPPQSGTYEITQDGGTLTFRMSWIDADGESHDLSFSGKPDGVPVPFNGGPLADALSISMPADDRLDSTAFFEGQELMRASRILSADRSSLDILQSVKLPDGSTPSNRATYRRLQ